MNFTERDSLEAEPDINIIPLIDVLFFIIIFFVMSTSFMQNGGLDVNLPTAATKRAETKSEEIVITVAKDGEFAVQGKRMSLEDLQRELKVSAEHSPRPVIVIQADKDTLHGRVVELMDLARSSGFEQLSVATVPK